MISVSSSMAASVAAEDGDTCETAPAHGGHNAKPAMSAMHVLGHGFR
jgi:hypothetical protein